MQNALASAALEAGRYTEIEREAALNNERLSHRQVLRILKRKRKEK